MMKKTITFMIFLGILFSVCLFLASFVSATSLQEGSQGSRASGVGNDFRAYSWNLVNPISAPTYNYCIIPGMTQTPMSSNSVYNIPVHVNENMIVLPRVTVIDIYDYNCNLQAELNYAAESNILLTNFNGDSYMEITFVSTSNNFTVLQFNETTQNFDLKINQNLTAAAYVDVSCTREYPSFPMQCLVFKAATTTAYNLSITNFTVSSLSVITDATYNFNNPTVYHGFPFAPTDDINYIETMYSCRGVQQTQNKINCSVINSNGKIKFSNVGSNMGGANVPSGVFINTIITQFSGMNKYISSSEITDSPNVLKEIMLVDDNGNKIFTESKNTQGTNYSNIVVGSFIKAQGKMWCYVTSTSANTYFTCRDNSGVSRLNFTTGAYLNNTPIMIADFNPASSYLGIGTSEGIFYYTGSVLAPYFESNLTKNLIKDSFMMIDQPASTQAPAYIVGDGTNAYIIRNTLGALSCGDGICAPDEDQWNCIFDCGNVTGQCTVDAECPSAYPKCFSYQCVAGFSNLACVDNYGCPYNASICYNGYCVNAVYAGFLPNETGTNTNVAVNYGAAIDNMISSLFVGSVLLRFIVGLILLLSLTLYLNAKYNINANPLLTIIVFAVLLVLFTFGLGLINRWVMYSIVVLTLSLVILSFIVGFRTRTPGT